MMLNSTNLNKVIKWTSSKFNELKKKEVIEIILAMQVGEVKFFNCGSYTENAWNGGLSYKVYRTTKNVVIENNSHKTIIFEVEV